MASFKQFAQFVQNVFKITNDLVTKNFIWIDVVPVYYIELSQEIPLYIKYNIDSPK